MIIEYVGIPGVGKSTLASITQDILGEFGLKTMSVPEAGSHCLKRMFFGRILCSITPAKWQQRILFIVFRRLVLLYRLIFALKNVQLTWRVVIFTLNRQTTWHHKHRPLHWFFRDAGYYQFFQNYLQSDEIVVLEEGIVQRITSLYASPSKTLDIFEIAWYVTHLPLIDWVVWVQVPLDVCIDRVNSREVGTRYQNKDLRLFMSNSVKTLDVALQTLNDMGAKVIELDNNRTLEISTTDLRSKLSEKL